MWTMTARQALCASTLTQCPAMCATAARTATPHSHTRHAHTTTTHTHPLSVTHAEPWPRRPSAKVWRRSACHRTLGILVVPQTYGTPSAVLWCHRHTRTARRRNVHAQHRVMEPQQRDTAPAVRAAAVDWLRCIHLPGLQPTIHTRDPVLWQRATPGSCTGQQSGCVESSTRCTCTVALCTACTSTICAAHGRYLGTAAALGWQLCRAGIASSAPDAGGTRHRVSPEGVHHIASHTPVRRQGTRSLPSSEPRLARASLRSSGRARRGSCASNIATTG